MKNMIKNLYNLTSVTDLSKLGIRFADNLSIDI